MPTGVADVDSLRCFPYRSTGAPAALQTGASAPTIPGGTTRATHRIRNGTDADS